MSLLGTVTVVGAGSYGTALAMQLARQGVDTRLWGRDAEAMAAMAEAGENARYLPGAKFPAKLTPEADLATALDGTDAVLLAVPSHALRAACEQVRPLVRDALPAISAAKGLEPESCKFGHEVIAEALGGERPIAILSGPTFAKELARGIPSAVTIASADASFGEHVADAMHGAGFRAYTTDDMVGVQIGGAVKNVLAIGVGIADGLGLGANSRAALITRGLAEMGRLSDELGGRSETLMGLAGMGDLVLTCTDDQSRNRRFGLALASGKTVDEAQADIGQVVEGYRVAREVRELARARQVDMPITEQVYQVLYEGQAPVSAVLALSTRPQRAESD